MNNEIKPLIWIVIPTWNRGKDLMDCLGSINNLIYTNYRIVVVDNGSQDDTLKLLQSEYPDVNLIQLNKNLGASFATNKGFDYALANGADLVLRLDSDTILDENYLTLLTQSILNMPKAGIVSGKIMSFYQPEKVWFSGGNLIHWNLGAKYIHQHKEFEYSEDRPIEVDLLPSTGMLITRETIESLSGFDQDFLVYYEDFDFCLRALEKEIKLYYVPQARIWHKVYSQKKTAWVAMQWNKSRMIYYRKHAFNNFHKAFMIFYAFLYAFFRSVFPSEGRGNWGPLYPALQGLKEGALVPLINPTRVKFN